MVAAEKVRSSWKAVTGAVKEKWGQITGDDLSKVEGNVDQLISLLQRKTGETRDRIEAFVSDIVSNTEGTVNRVADVASQYAGQAGEALRENYDAVVSSAQRGYDETKQMVSHRPMESVAIALGAGLLTGLIVGLSLGRQR